MTIDICGNPNGKRILLLPGTCCTWQTNFDRLIPCLEKDYLLLCANYSGFDHSGNLFSTMLDETAKIEELVAEKFEGKIDLAYGSSLGGSFVGLLVQRKRISIAHAVIGSSDFDQMGRISGWFYAKFVTAFLMKMVKNPSDNKDFQKMLQEKMGMDLGPDGEEYLKNYFLTLKNTDRRSVFNQFYSDLVTPLGKSIQTPGCRVHIMYAKRMGSEYLKRYRKHFADPDIHEFDMGHEGWLFDGELMKQEFEKYMEIQI